MARHKNSNWNLPDGTPAGGNTTTHSWDAIHAALLMDIRDELQALNRKLDCPTVSKAVHAVVRMDRRAAKNGRK